MPSSRGSISTTPTAAIATATSTTTSRPDSPPVSAAVNPTSPHLPAQPTPLSVEAPAPAPRQGDAKLFPPPKKGVCEPLREALPKHSTEHTRWRVEAPTAPRRPPANTMRWSVWFRRDLRRRRATIPDLPTGLQDTLLETLPLLDMEVLVRGEAVVWQQPGQPDLRLTLLPSGHGLRSSVIKIEVVGSELAFIMKVFCFHSRRRYNMIKHRDCASKVPRAAGVHPQPAASLDEAANELLMAQALNCQAVECLQWEEGPFLAPLAACVRPCSCLGTSLDGGYDNELAVLYECIKEGDATNLVPALLRGAGVRVPEKEEQASLHPVQALAAGSAVSRGVVTAIKRVTQFMALLQLAGVVHCDLKPSNLVGGPDTLKMIDADSLRVSDVDGIVRGWHPHTPFYAGDEQQFSSRTAGGGLHAPYAETRSDTHAFGVSGFEFLEEARSGMRSCPLLLAAFNAQPAIRLLEDMFVRCAHDGVQQRPYFFSLCEELGVTL